MPEITLKKSELKKLITEEVRRLSETPSREITNDIISEINTKIASVKSLLPEFVEKSKQKNDRANYKQELLMLNEKLDELMAVLTDGGKNG